jgi:hypothetical protein
MRRKHFVIFISVVGVLAAIGAAVGGSLYYLYPVQVTTFAAMTRNYLISWSAPPGTTTTEMNSAYKAAEAAAPSPPAAASSAGCVLMSPRPSALVVQAKVNSPEMPMIGLMFRHCASRSTVP